MDQGRMAIALDPTGAAFGLWQAGTSLGASLVAPGSGGIAGLLPVFFLASPRQAVPVC